jgi:hypothetical protein
MAIIIKRLPGIRFIRFLYSRLKLHLSLKHYNGYFFNASDKRLLELNDIRKGKK